jgi:hypothetical protein
VDVVVIVAVRLTFDVAVVVVPAPLVAAEEAPGVTMRR